jgi:two-component system, sensor histidine kinase and response regulator
MKANILIVDDLADNLKLLMSTLSKINLRSRPVKSGKLALATAFTMPPDLILLDIMLPDMSGYEVCEKLKADERTSHIPVIFLSSLNDPIDKVRGFSVGGVDYISKPFNASEVIARIENHLAIFRLQKELSKKNQQLTELNATKDKFFSIIAHDLKNPFVAILGFSELLINGYDNYSDKDRKDLIKQIYISSKKEFGLLENLLEWSLIQMNKIEFEPKILKITELISFNIDLYQSSLQNKQIKLEYKKVEDIFVYSDKNMIDVILRNLLSNAIKFTPKNGLITIDCKLIKEEKKVSISISDTGVGISESDIEKIFNIENSYSKPGTENEIGTGLGLILCNDFVEKNGGEINVESEIGKGSTFWFTLPTENFLLFRNC